MKPIQILAMVTFGTFVSAATLGAQQSPFDDPENLKVLPKDISPGELRETMRGFSFALGVRCTHCHVAQKTDAGTQMQFPKDDKEPKKIAREMLRMVADINKRISGLSRGANHQYTKVTCMSCHRGQDKPVLIETILDTAVAEGGASAALEKYTELKSQFFGGHTYDFSGFTLSEYASSLAARGQGDAGLAIAQYSAKNNPDVGYAFTVLAGMHMNSQRFGEAAAAYEGALKISPNSRFLKSRLEAAQKAAAEAAATQDQ